MAIDFPATPNVGDVYSDGGRSWRWNGSGWTSRGAPSQTFTTSDTAPASPNVGDVWFNSSSGITYIYYDSVWVEIGNTAAVTSFIADTDADTTIKAEESSDEDRLRFDIAGNQVMLIDPSGVSVDGSATVNYLLSSGDVDGATINGSYVVSSGDVAGSTINGSYVVSSGDVAGSTINGAYVVSSGPVAGQLVITGTSAGEPTDIVSDGGILIDTNTNTLYFRSNSVWQAAGQSGGLSPFLLMGA